MIKIRKGTKQDLPIVLELGSPLRFHSDYNDGILNKKETHSFE